MPNDKMQFKTAKLIQFLEYLRIREIRNSRYFSKIRKIKTGTIRVKTWNKLQHCTQRPKFLN